MVVTKADTGNYDVFDEMTLSFFPSLLFYIDFSQTIKKKSPEGIKCFSSSWNRCKMRIMSNVWSSLRTVFFSTFHLFLCLRVECWFKKNICNSCTFLSFLQSYRCVAALPVTIYPCSVWQVTKIKNKTGRCTSSWNGTKVPRVTRSLHQFLCAPLLAGSRTTSD